MYTTGTASGPAALLQALASWCTGAGWTVDNNASPTGGGWWLAIHNGSCFINLVANSADNQITMFGATGFNSASAPSAQANTSPNSVNVCNSGAGPYTAYHFFGSSGSDAYLHIVIEKSTNLFAHIHVGALKPVGGASPCIYIQATNWNYTGSNASFLDNINVGNTAPWSNAGPQGYVGVTVDSTFKWFRPGLGAGSRSVVPHSTGGLQISNENASPNTFNGLPILLSMPVFVERASTGIYSYVGDPADMRLINLANNAPKDEITIGSDTWKVFPFIARALIVNVTNAPVSSGFYGYAFRKNA